MTQQPPILVIDVIGEVVAAVDAALFQTLGKHIDFQPGRSSQIQTELQKISGGTKPDTVNARYPLVALFYDFPQDKGNSGYYLQVTIPKISIACLTVNTDPVLKRYDKTFRPILYPIYLEFMRQLCRHKNIVGNDPNAILHKVWERPGNQPEGQNMNDYLDAIEISNLQLTFKKVNNCKSLNS